MTTEYNTVSKTVESGDITELGELKCKNIEHNTGNSIQLTAIEGGEKESYAVLTANIEDSSTVELPTGSVVLGIAAPESSFGEPSLWYLTPLSNYGGGE